MSSKLCRPLQSLLWTLAFQTKQSILPAAFVMLCFDFGMHRRRLQRTLTGVLVLALGAAGTVLWLNHATGGWYSFYVFTVPAANTDLLLRRLIMLDRPSSPFWTEEVFAGRRNRGRGDPPRLRIL